MGFKESIKKIGSDVYSSASKTAENIADKSKVLAEKSKLKKQIGAEQSAIMSKYNEMGRRLYDANKNSAPAGFEEDFKFISEAFVKISELQEELKELDIDYSCPSCGMKLKKEQVFCHLCGAATNFNQDNDEENQTEGTTNTGNEIINVSANDIEVK